MTGRPPLAAGRPGPGGERPLSVVAPIAPGAAPPVPPEGVTCLELRADLADLPDSRRRAAGEPATADLRAGDDHAGAAARDLHASAFDGGLWGGCLLYTLRSVAEGGGCADPPERRHARLIAAAGSYDYVDLEADRDLHPDVLDRIPPERRVISWHGPAESVGALRRRFAAMAAVRAHLYRLGPAAGTMAQAAAPLLLLKSLGRGDVAAYARGPAGAWTRALAPRFGAAVAFGGLDAGHDRSHDSRHDSRHDAGHDRGNDGGRDNGRDGGRGRRLGGDDGPLGGGGELTARRLAADYPPELLLRAERAYGIIGASTAGSLCPLAHNDAYRSLGLPAVFLPFSSGDLAGSLDDLAGAFDELGLPLRALAVVQPHKDAAYELAAVATPFARRAGAASLLVRSPSGGWWADTEAAGVILALARAGIPVARRRVAVVGCGGAGRAAGAGLNRAGARVTMVNRGVRAGRRAARRLGLPFVPLRGFDPRGYDLIVHATPVKDALTFPLNGLRPATAIFDLTYSAAETVLAAKARAAGHPTIDGRQMTRVELARQFHRMTGRHIPAGIVRAAQREFSDEPSLVT